TPNPAPAFSQPASPLLPQPASAQADDIQALKASILQLQDRLERLSPPSAETLGTSTRRPSEILFSPTEPLREDPCSANVFSFGPAGAPAGKTGGPGGLALARELKSWFPVGEPRRCFSRSRRRPAPVRLRLERRQPDCPIRARRHRGVRGWRLFPPSPPPDRRDHVSTLRVGRGIRFRQRHRKRHVFQYPDDRQPQLQGRLVRRQRLADPWHRARWLDEGADWLRAPHELTLVQLHGTFAGQRLVDAALSRCPRPRLERERARHLGFWFLPCSE